MTLAIAVWKIAAGLFCGLLLTLTAYLFAIFCSTAAPARRLISITTASYVNDFVRLVEIAPLSESEWEARER